MGIIRRGLGWIVEAAGSLRDAGNPSGADAARIEAIAAGLALLAAPPEIPAGEPVRIVLGRALDEAIAGRGLAGRSRIRRIGSDPPVAVETARPGALAWTVGGLLDAVLEAAGSGGEVILRLDAGADRAEIVAEVLARGEGREEAPPTGGGFPVDLLRQVAAEALGGHLRIPTAGPPALSLLIPLVPPGRGSPAPPPGIDTETVALDAGGGPAATPEGRT
jgi:hypothetical protein